MPVEEVRLTSEALAITVWSYGATLVEVRCPDRQGRWQNVVVRLPDLAAYERRAGRAYVGATMGRYARCVAGARAKLDGRVIELTRSHGIHHLHGGDFGFDSFVWDVIGEECNDQRVAVRMRLRRPDGDEGYPGDITAETTYAIEHPNTLVFEHTATTTATTLCDITNHAMWNLTGVGTIDGQLLTVNANRVLLVDRDLIPVDDPVQVDRSELDLRAATPLAGVRLDHCFVLDDPSWAARLQDPGTGRCMTVVTDQPGLQIYTADMFQHPRQGICLQAGSWPNAPVRPDYPSARLEAGQFYRSRTAHRFDCTTDLSDAMPSRHREH